MALDPWGQHILNFWDVWQRDDALKCSLGVPSGNWLACWRGGLSLLETGHVWNLNGSYEFLRWVRIWRSMLQGRSFLGSRDLWFSDRMAFPRVCADLLFGKCGLAKSRSTHGLDVGIRPCAPSCSVRTPLAGCGARAAVPAMRGLKGQCTMPIADSTAVPRRAWHWTLEANTSWIFGMYDSETMR